MYRDAWCKDCVKQFIHTRADVVKYCFENNRKWATVGVLTAEQLWPDHGMGSEKFAFVKQYLAEKGYNVELQEITIAIESAVFAMKEALEIVD